MASSDSKGQSRPSQYAAKPSFPALLHHHCRTRRRPPLALAVLPMSKSSRHSGEKLVTKEPCVQLFALPWLPALQPLR